MITRPNEESIIPFLKTYTDKVKSDDLMAELHQNKLDFEEFIQTIPEQKEQYTYAEGKWTVLQLIQHIIDCERLYYHRAFRFSRLDKTELSGFDVDLAMDGIDKDRLDIKHQLKEFSNLRQASIDLYETMGCDQLDFVGKANGIPMTARIQGYVTVGHCVYHMEKLKELYL